MERETGHKSGHRALTTFPPIVLETRFFSRNTELFSTKIEVKPDFVDFTDTNMSSGFATLILHLPQVP